MGSAEGTTRNMVLGMREWLQNTPHFFDPVSGAGAVLQAHVLRSTRKETMELNLFNGTTLPHKW